MLNSQSKTQLEEKVEELNNKYKKTYINAMLLDELIQDEFSTTDSLFDNDYDATSGSYSFYLYGENENVPQWLDVKFKLPDGINTMSNVDLFIEKFCLL